MATQKAEARKGSPPEVTRSQTSRLKLEGAVLYGQCAKVEGGPEEVDYLLPARFSPALQS